MSEREQGKPIEILLVEDNPGDARLTKEALKEAKVRNSLYVVNDGEEAIHYLHKEGKYADSTKPDLILLDLNLPKMDGREVLKKIKHDESLKRIPVVVLTSSKAEEDVFKAYDNHANCYITKPVDLEQFFTIAKKIDDFWLTIVQFPKV